MSAVRILGFLLLAAPLAASQPQPGDRAPDPGIEQFLGAPVVASWDGLAGQAIVMDLWATWCAPCVETLPHMAALAEAFADRPVQFLSVTDEPFETTAPFLRERTLAGWVGIDEDGSATAAYGVAGIPAVVLIAPSGRLDAVTHPSEVDAAVLEALLAGAPLDVEPAPRGTSIRERAAAMRAARPAVADGPPTFEARWGRGDEFGGVQWNLREGWLSASGAMLRPLLARLWASRAPSDEDPLGMSMRLRFVELPDTLRRATVFADVREPDLGESAFPRHVLAGLSERLGLDVRVERRPAIVFALRPGADRPVRLRPSGPPRGASSRGAVFSARGVTASELARSLGGSLGHPVVDETGLEGTYTVTLELDPDVVDFDPSVMTWESLEGVRAGLLEATGLELVPEVRPVEWLVVTVPDDA